MKIPAAILLGLLVPVAVASAQPVPQDQVPRLPAIDAKALEQKFDNAWLLARLQSRFARIKSYTYAYHWNRPQDPGYFVECWKEMGDVYYQEFEEPAQKMHDTFVYDGAHTSLSSGSGNICVRKGESPYGKPQTAWQSPLDVYAFLNTDHQYLSMKRLGPDARIWKDIAGRMDYAGTATFLGCDCIIMRVRGAFSEMKEEKATYDVYFDTATFAPVGWQSYDDQGNMIDELTLVGLKPFAGQQDHDVAPFVFVPHYKVTQYQWLGIIRTGPDGKAIPYYKGSREEVFDDVRVNALGPDDLKLDMSQARSITDTDTKKVTLLKK